MTPPVPFEAKHVSVLWAGPERCDEIAAMHGRLFQPPWDAASVAKLLEHPASTAFVGQIGAPKISVGFIMGQLMADEAEILAVGVAPELQRRGLGRILVEAFARAAKRAEAKSLHLEVAADNPAALALYAKLGFSEARRRAGYYERPGGAAAVDALVLKLAL